MTPPEYTATPAEVVNDLEAHASHLSRTHYRDHARSMARGAATIRALMAQIDELKSGAAK